jgi:phenylalanyl-tRNA synthetase beta chain
MKISLSWLRQFITLPESVTEIASLLTSSGLEVEHIEAIEQVAGGLKGFVIGQVLTCEQHPNADKLRVTTVDIGTEPVLNIVCGAPNVAAGQKVIVATIGTVLPGDEGIVIKKSKIRGELSEGMICAEDEMGLGTNHDGILVLDTDLPLGTPAAKYFNLESDYQLEIGLTPNRADAASHLGVARDLRALLQRPIQWPNAEPLVIPEIKDSLTLHVEAIEACPRYCGVVIKGVKVGPSPDWLAKKLRSIGLSPINNIVDSTNYVLHGFGQPLHAFDRDAIKGDAVLVRLAHEGEKLLTLDNVEKTLLPNNLVIADAENAMCIGGVFGGKDSGVKDSTTSIFLESAYFSATSIRKTSQQHGLKTDASYRYERGTDPHICREALIIAANLIMEVAGGSVASEILEDYPNPIQNRELVGQYAKIERLIGYPIDRERIHVILRSLDISIQPIADDYGHEGFETNFRAFIPPYRVDVTSEADLAEEVIRIYGLDNLPLSDVMSTTFVSAFPKVDASDMQFRTASFLAAQGFVEMLNNSITAPAWHRTVPSMPAEKDVVILNPLSEELSAMRQSLLFSGLNIIAYNINRRQGDLRLFEFGKVYGMAANSGYFEEHRLSLFAVGKEGAETWQGNAEKVGFYTLVNTLSGFFTRMGITVKTVPSEVDYLHYGLEFKVKKVVLATVGLVNRACLKPFDIKTPVYFADISWERVLSNYSPSLKAVEVSKFPSVRRDLSLVFAEGLSFVEIERVISNAESKLLKDVNVFDVFVGEKLAAEYGEGKKSYSISLELEDSEKTLTDVIIEASVARILAALEKQCGAVLRK